MSSIALIIGGRQSGKTYQAEKLAKAYERPLFLSGHETDNEIHKLLEDKKPDLIIVELSRHHDKAFCYPFIDTIFTCDKDDVDILGIDTQAADTFTLINLKGFWIKEEGEWVKKMDK